MKRNQFSFWFLVSNKSETRPIRWAPKLQLRHRFQRGPANKTAFSAFSAFSNKPLALIYRTNRRRLS